MQWWSALDIDIANYTGGLRQQNAKQKDGGAYWSEFAGAQVGVITKAVHVLYTEFWATFDCCSLQNANLS